MLLFFLALVQALLEPCVLRFGKKKLQNWIKLREKPKR